MVIILCLYVVALWLVFSRFKLVRWSWLSGTLAALVGIFILAAFLALFNYLTPSGRVTVTGRVVEVTPNVTGQIVAIPVKPNVPVKIGDVLFQIDPAPFQYKVAQLQASLAGAKQQAEILKANYDQATANVAGLAAQVRLERGGRVDLLGRLRGRRRLVGLLHVGLGDLLRIGLGDLLRIGLGDLLHADRFARGRVTVEGSHGFQSSLSLAQPNTSMTSLARPRSARPTSATMNARNASTTPV